MDKEVVEERRAVRHALIVVAWQDLLTDLIGAVPTDKAMQEWASENPGDYLSLLIVLLWWLRGQPDFPEAAVALAFSPEVVRFSDRFKIAMLEIEANWGP